MLVDYFTNKISESLIDTLSSLFGQDSFFGVFDTITDTFTLPIIISAPLIVVVGLSITYLLIGR